MNRLTTRQLRLKDSTRKVQESLGGTIEAGKITGKSKTQHGRFQSPHDPDFANICDVLEMEAVAPRDAQWPPVTRLLCQMAGGVFLPLPDTETCETGLALELCTLAKEFGDLAGAVHDGMADGTFQPDEAYRALREGQELQAKLAAFNRMLEGMVEAGHGPTVRGIREVGTGTH
ncbi:phage regulatory CII family protein [Croceicoccus sp. BE223]|uniref:phage regulatory CII family protein n=1 Tax=Croceicoccus sp. BE223 TaxID=2817716 RepID=UPI00285ED3DE|nr:phage regulatory CII family protein [Croceicoccus sp. BE223]MDR7102968.1 hypothetical protein [Croceicoccus sp. BE223]